MSPVTSKNDINDFLAQHTIALIGVSRDKKHFSRRILEEFVKRGYDVRLVHPSADAVDGHPCAKSVSSINGGIDGAMLLVPKEAVRQSVEDCLRAGVTRIWMYGTRGEKGLDPAHIAMARSDGAKVIAGHCPMMFFSDAGWFHRVHGWVQRISGGSPQ